MAKLLKGKDVAAALNAKSTQKAAALKEKGIIPVLAILRVGEKGDDISYEKGAMKRCSAAGVEVKNVVLPEDVSQEEFYQKIDDLNHDPSVHGILMFRPLPKYLDNEKARNAIAPEKDIDGCSDGSLAGVFTGNGRGFAPCTAEAAIAMLEYYGIDITGKNAVIIGRSLVVGRPLAMMLMAKNATVTICHTRTQNMAEITRKADIVISCMGRIEILDSTFFSPGQTVIDVGITWSNEKQKVCGDCLFEEVEPVVKAITPVPGGVGAVTTSLLVKHVIEAAEKTETQS
ncbi:MAG: bifunctional 5,10-methylenetetrahydrofolate dehydrogenase/5,10-methenyltetrahydrofolate cyclohydrolase [Erysipelotrichaceae bacterium]|nr:bifunctional 5,10-methylenetetrahydrofolate dehydrogenase/5,10-methenyltetrahydrofolate cyclohydrolase [Erysipelotrichaceae bacterium]